MAKKQEMTLTTPLHASCCVASPSNTKSREKEAIYNSNFSFGAVAYDFNLLVNLLSGHCSPEP